MGSRGMAMGQSLRDRTADFNAITARLQKQAGVAAESPMSASHAAVKQAVQQQSEFARKASQIGLSIHKTSVKLQKLAQLAKRTSMFDDPTREIDEMTGIIKHDIQGLNMAIADLQRLSGKKDENKQSADHSHTVVDNLRSRLKDATLQFKDVLTLRTENLKVHNERRQLFSAQPDGGAGLLETAPLLGSNAAGGQHGSSSSSNGPGGLPGSSNGSSSSRPTAAGLFGQQQQQPGGGGGMLMQQQYAPQESAYSASRAEALHNVETTIVELGSIFTQLAEMVAAQGEMTQRIDENVEETLANVDNAKAQLMKYLNTISSNRWLMLKAFGVLMIFLVIFISFIA